jgi:methylthioribulose-1-phosphate dehydratase
VAKILDDLAPCAALVEAARDFYARGWMAGTAGNLSVRRRDAQALAGDFWITASGLSKGGLDEQDFLRIAIADGEVLERLRPGLKPSAETAIHRVIYQCVPQAGACLHVHSVDASIVSERAPVQALEIPLPPLEMIKGFDIWQQSPKVAMPLFANTLDVSLIAEEIGRRFYAHPPAVPVLMIRGHGVTVWGGSLQQAYNRLEIAEFILNFMSRA